MSFSLEKFSHVQPTDAQQLEVAGLRGACLGLAQYFDSTLPTGPEATTALRKLMEAKDCAVRAVIFPGL